MMDFLRKHMRKIFIVTIVAFLGGTFVGGGAYLFGPAKDMDAAATVNGSKVPLKLFNSVYTASVEMYKNASDTALTEEQLEEIKMRTIQAMVQEELFYQQSIKYGILVSDAELKNDIQRSGMFINEKREFEPNRYYAFLNSIRMTPKEYENMRRKQLSGEKLKMLLASSINISDSELENAIAETGTEMNKEDLLQTKGNIMLNEWFMGVVDNSKIVTNNAVFSRI